MSLSANGNITATGILWALHPLLVGNVTDGVLRAYDAADVSNELSNSTQDTERNSVGAWAKINVPTIANGRVYVASFSDRLDAYRIMGAPWVITQPLSQAANSGHSASLSVVVSGQGPLTYQWYRWVSGDTQNPVGTNSSSYTTPPLGLPESFWVRASNGQGHIDSATVQVGLANPIYLPLVGR